MVCRWIVILNVLQFKDLISNRPEHYYYSLCEKYRTVRYKAYLVNSKIHRLLFSKNGIQTSFYSTFVNTAISCKLLPENVQIFTPINPWHCQQSLDRNECAEPLSFWYNVFEFMSKTLHTLKKEKTYWQTFIFNLSEKLHKPSQSQQIFVYNFTTTQKKEKCQVIMSKCQETLSVRMWLWDTISTSKFERISFLKKDLI